MRGLRSKIIVIRSLNHPINYGLTSSEISFFEDRDHLNLSSSL